MKRLLSALILLSGVACAAPEEELLPAEKAFELSTHVEGTVLQVNWRIAPGYYLYRDKFRFESLDSDLRLREPKFPAATAKEDRVFGRTAIYTAQVSVAIPFEVVGTAADPRVRIIAQGCNEPIGVCYPPMTKEVSLLSVSSPTRAFFKTTGSGGNLAKTFAFAKQEDEVVDPEKAFQVAAAAIDGSTIGVRFTIDDCCYLYRDKMRFGISAPDGTPLVNGLGVGVFELPHGEAKTDEFFGTTEVYHGIVDMRVPLYGENRSAADFLLKVTYQGCAEKGVKLCYPPATREFPIRLVTALGADNAARSSDGFLGLLAAMLGAFAGGLLLTFTPCVLPMVPILSGVIVGTEGARLTRVRGGLLSYTYVLGTALTYAIAGAIAGATGEQLQAYFQNAWAIGIFSAVLLLLALSMFGFYELQIPAAMQSFLHHHSTKLHHRTKGSISGKFIGVFLLGAISALIIGACVSPVLVTALGNAITAGDPWRGAAVMFALANGQGAILVVIGVSEGFLLPRTGPWMNKVKHFFGVLLIAAAIYLLGALPQVPVMFLWGGLFIVSAVYLGATQALPKEGTGWQYFQKGIGTLLLVWGIVALLGGFLGSRDLLSPLAPLDRAVTQSKREPGTRESLFKPVRSLSGLEAELAQAQRAGKPVILDYYATWCTDCVRMEQSTFLDAKVRETIAARFTALQADVTETTDPEVSAIKRRFNVFGPPAILFFGSDGQERRDLKAQGYKSVAEFLAILSQL
jgi:thiol:disulfide interchange protein DsbD